MKKTLIGALALSVSMTAMSGAAMAQEKDESLLGEIIVTAQKKAENLQDVSISVAAFDEDLLETYQIDGPEDLATFTPGVYSTPNPADNNGVRINIRGIGTLDPQIGQDSRVAVYRDGVYLGRTQGLAFDMPDLQRVEILKGPQGTLYGRNTVAGAVNLVSNAPDASGFSGSIGVEAGSFNHREISGVVNVPLGERAAFRLAARHGSKDGWVENDGPGTDFGGYDKFGVRGALGFDMSESWNVTLAYDYSKVENEPLFYQATPDFGAGAVFAAATQNPRSGRADTVTTSFAPEEGNLESKGVTLISDWEWGDNHSLKFTAAYRELDSSRFTTLMPEANPFIINQVTAGFNQALIPLAGSMAITGNNLRADWGTQIPGNPDDGLFLSGPGGSPSIDSQEQTSLELTYNGEFRDSTIEFTGGLFYYDEDTANCRSCTPNLNNANDYLHVLALFDSRVTPASVSTYLAGFGQTGLGPIPGSLALAGIRNIPGQQAAADAQLAIVNGLIAAGLDGARETTANDIFIETNAMAVYGEALFHLSEDFRVRAGLRYSMEEKDGRGIARSPIFRDQTTLMGNPIPENVDSVDDNVLDPTLVLEYDANDDVMLYASFKKSYRASGFNAVGIASPVPPATSGADFKFGKESITAYEVGFKGDFTDRFRLNMAAFYYDFKDKQTTIGLNRLISTVRAVVNADDKIWGFEADSVLAFSEHLKGRFGYTYIDGDAGDVTNPLTGAVDVRDDIQGTPKHSFNIALDYKRPIFDSAEFFGNVNYSYKDDILAIPQSQVYLPSVSLLNARLGVSMDTDFGETAYIALWAKNLADEEYLIDSLPFETFAHRHEVYGSPRTVGISAGIKF